jgi:hypothetical protein
MLENAMAHRDKSGLVSSNDGALWTWCSWSPAIETDITSHLSSVRSVYGCSATLSSCGAARGGAVKIDKLVNISGRHWMQAADTRRIQDDGCVDQRTWGGIRCSAESEYLIKAFRIAAQTGCAGCWKGIRCCFIGFMRSALTWHNRLFRFSRIGPSRPSQ